MGCGPITNACRAFLSRNHLYPGHVSRWLLAARPRPSKGGSSRTVLLGPGADRHRSTRVDRSQGIAALVFHPASGNTLLNVRRRDFRYVEHGSGIAHLVLFDRQLPETVCMGLPRDRYRLSEIIAYDHDPFFAKSDPIVRRMRNARKGRRNGLIITLVPVWKDENWDYSDGLDGWYE